MIKHGTPNTGQNMTHAREWLPGIPVGCSTGIELKIGDWLASTWIRSANELGAKAIGSLVVWYVRSLAGVMDRHRCLPVHA